MCYEILDPLLKITEHKDFGTLIGAVIGGLIGAGSAYLVPMIHEKRKEKKEHIAWLQGLSAELKHIGKCITEIKDILNNNGTPSKRINFDFIEKSRLTFFKLNSDVAFLECLTNTYRDIVHTNGMLDYFGNNPQTKSNVLASMQGVENSVKCLDCKVKEKLK